VEEFPSPSNNVLSVSVVKAKFGFSAQDETPKPALFRWALTTLGNSDPLGDKNSYPFDELSSLQGKTLMICGTYSWWLIFDEYSGEMNKPDSLNWSSHPKMTIKSFEGSRKAGDPNQPTLHNPTRGGSGLPHPASHSNSNPTPREVRAFLLSTDLPPTLFFEKWIRFSV
jgi:hypothetical protein